ncbi:MAG: hypothetical protein ACLFPL_04465 [Candidatus Nanoarchaeia archaeon]
MALFHKDSDSEQEQDVNRVKEATSNNQQSFSPSMNSNQANNSMQQNSQEQFVNPFTQTDNNLGMNQEQQNMSASQPQSQYPMQQQHPQSNMDYMQQQQHSVNNNNFAQQNSAAMPSLWSSQFPSSSVSNSTSEQQNLPSMSEFQNSNGQLQMNSNFDPTPQQNNQAIQQQQMNENLSREQIQEMINETIESLFESRWESLTENVRKVVEWKEQVEGEVKELQDDIEKIRDGFSTLEKKIMSKLNSYDKNVLDIESEIKAMDKVFQKITPTLVNNVTELGRIAKDLKGVSSNSSSKRNHSSNDDDNNGK